MMDPLYAGFWRRVAAYIADNVILLIPGVGLSLLTGGDAIAGLLLQTALWGGYKAGMESSASQATLGKKWVGIKVTDRDGERITFLRALGRFFANYLSALLLCIGYLMAAFTGKKQALHDLLASTVVVRDTATPEDVATGGGTMPITGRVWVAAAVFLLVPVAGIVAAVAIPAYQDYGMRVRIMGAIADGKRVRDTAAGEIGKYQDAADKSGIETQLRMPATSADVTGIVVDKPARRVVVRLDKSKFPSYAIADDPAVAFSLDPSGAWTCRGVGLPNRYLPPECRT